MKPSEVGQKLGLPPHIQEKISVYGEQGVRFLTEPNSSNAAWYWSFFMCFCTLVNVVFLILSSMDGPNHYENEKNMSTYPKLLTAEEYRLAASVIWSPMLFDAFLRILSVSAIYLFNDDEASEFSEDIFKVTLFFMDLLSVIPFIFLNGYYYAKDSTPNTYVTLFFRCLELLSSAKILRGTKDLPSVLAIRITLVRAIPHLILPVFFFLVFNIFFGVVVYFMEPCYNYERCAWANLFEASFYSVVTMTTTGYGNQVPLFLPARFIGVIIMLFGSVFMSMPLAIIGNEYADAWSSLKSEKTIETVDNATDNLENSLPLQVGRGPDRIKTKDSTQAMLRKMSSTEVKREAYTLTQQALLSPLIECRKNLDSSVANLGLLLRPAKKMNPAILLAMCELRGWIAPLLWNIRVAVRTVDHTAKVEASQSRKLSVFRSVMTSPDPDSIPSGNSSAPLAGYVRSGAKVASQPSSLGALQETPEDDVETSEYSCPPSLPTKVSSTVVPQLPPVKRGRPPTTHPNTPAGKSHMQAVKHFLSSSGVKPEPTEASGGVPLRPSFWPISSWGGGLRTPTERSESTPGDERARVAPCPTIQPLGVGDSEDEKSGEDLVVAATRKPIGPSSEDRKSIQKTKSEELVKQIKINRAQHAIASLQKQPSLGRLTKQRSMESMTFLIKLAKAAPDIAKMRGDGTDFSQNMERAVQNPKALRTKLWMLMELPSSSRAARWIQMYLLLLIMLSVLILYTQTLPSFTTYSESCPLCGTVLQIYCVDKDDPLLDPGCFIQTPEGISSTQKLKFGCSSSDCFGYGANFGSDWTNMTCNPSVYIRPGYVRPFQTLDSLTYNIRAADFTVPRDKMHMIEDICYRMECRYDSPQIVDGNAAWLPLEIIINLSFTLEILLRVAVSFSWSSFFLDFMNIFDILSVIPFYLDIINGFRSKVFNFAIIASSPDPIIFVTMKSLKVFRLFKMTRHFSASQVLFQTAGKAWKQILGMISLLVFIVTIFALLLYEVEKGSPCYVGNSDCDVPEDIAGTVHTGQLIWIDKNGEVSMFASVLDALWFAVVTLSSTGYGDMVPGTNLGQIFAIFLMLFGAFYLAMPLTVVATTFWESHQSYLEKQKKKKIEANKKLLDEMFLKKLNTLESVLVAITKRLDAFFTDIQQPSSSSTDSSSVKSMSFLERCVEIETQLINLMRVHDVDIKRLSVVYSNHVTNLNGSDTTAAGVPDEQAY